jgi:hypothetical protein
VSKRSANVVALSFAASQDEESDGMQDENEPFCSSSIGGDDDRIAPVGNVLLHPSRHGHVSKGTCNGRWGTYRIMLGSVHKLSTGTSKNPWICDACRSMVITWSHPAICSMLATSLAVMGERDLSLRSCRSQIVRLHSSMHSTSMGVPFASRGSTG